MESKSMTISTKIQQSNYSALSNLPRHIINQIKNEGELYITAPNKCAKIWIEMRKNDFVTDAQLNFTIAQRIFEACRSEIVQLLKLQNEKDFFELFDQDNDGILNEDEQILVFSAIKEKMHQVATALLKIQEYILFKQLMKELRTLEANIAAYQNQLRQRISIKERQVYKEIGQEKLDDFYDKYYQEFQQLTKYKVDRRAQLKISQEKELGILEDRLSKDTELMKVKPKKKLKDLQTQEKLVSLEERVEEALDFRKELKDLEKHEQDRVYKVQKYRIEKQHSDLLFKQQKEREQLEGKLQETEYKLIIQMKKDYDVLLKQINLHNNEITRIQSQASNQAMKKGLYEGEAKRQKVQSQLQNAIIAQTKAISQPESKINDLDQFHESETIRKLESRKSLQFAGSPGKAVISEESEKSPMGSAFNGKTKNFYQIRKIIKDSKNITQFYIKKNYGADLPVNFVRSAHNIQGDQHEKIERFLSVKRKSQHELLPPITQLYDDDLQEKQIKAITKTDQEIKREKALKRAFINEKLFRND
ncbi:unnamed protein product (macronuclear) [Paramecium tetraurelia]|uniref:EF-hand domain-containing protein n=1 Tax=Paramecium tetraurelia TaxID=5888 RepID=A0E9J4_PARTE|nr:uncharacterized protein GSPATT00024692001 [Paramecium tetraurelia]CAK91961.1 unnamed protein product [Paramecium tetraurelia]|eukprot:XP_001459358.1 hypothetical protein (macronuclear) [Paramecium tetraurelia strain d4-2]